MTFMHLELDTSPVRAFGVKLDRTGGAVGAAAAAAVRTTARKIETTGKDLCPVASPNEENAVPGVLRDSISTSFTGDGRFAGITAETGPTAPYGEYVEDGTSEMPAEPYMGPAFDMHAPELESLLGKAAVGLL